MFYFSYVLFLIWSYSKRSLIAVFHINKTFLHVRFWSKEVSLGHDTVKILELWPALVNCRIYHHIVSDLEFVHRIAVKRTWYLNNEKVIYYPII